MSTRLLSHVVMAVVLLSCAALAGPSSLMAQNNPPGDRQDDGKGGGEPPLMVPDSAQAVKIVDELASELLLTNKQKEAVLEVHLAHFKEVKKLMDLNSNDRKSQRDKIEVLRKHLHSEMKELLSKKQYKEFEDYLKKQDPRPERPQRGR